MLLIFAMRWAKRMLAAMGVGAGIMAVVLALLVTFQEKLLYIPRIPGMSAMTDSPEVYDLDFEDVWLESKDKTRLHAWLLFPKGWGPSQRRRNSTIIFLQENAGNMAMRLPFLADLIKFYPCTIAAPSYRGYGKSSGSPHEKGIKEDTQAVLEHLINRPDIDSSKISILGKSLGGATGIHLAAANTGKIRSLIVENTFTSVEDVAYKVFPPLKFIIGRNKVGNVLIRNKWRNFKEIEKLVETPTLLLSSIQDEMLPSKQMRELYSILQNAGGKDVTWVEFERAGHMDAYLVEANYWPQLVHFLKTRNGSASDEYEDESGSSEDFEVVDRSPGLQTMINAEENPDKTIQSTGIRARHHQER